MCILTIFSTVITESAEICHFWPFSCMNVYLAFTINLSYTKTHDFAIIVNKTGQSQYYKKYFFYCNANVLRIFNIPHVFYQNISFIFLVAGGLHQQGLTSNLDKKMIILTPKKWILVFISSLRCLDSAWMACWKKLISWEKLFLHRYIRL